MRTLDQIKASIKTQHGYDIGDSGALMIGILEDECHQNRTLIEQATVRINQSQKPFHSDHPRAAFWFGVGRAGLWVLPVLVSIGLVAWFYQQRQEYQAIKNLLTRYPNAAKYEYFIKGASLEQAADGRYYIELQPAPAKGYAEVGKHYAYDPKCQCVEVPVAFSNSALH